MAVTAMTAEVRSRCEGHNDATNAALPTGAAKRVRGTLWRPRLWRCLWLTERWQRGRERPLERMKMPSEAIPTVDAEANAFPYFGPFASMSTQSRTLMHCMNPNNLEAFSQFASVSHRNGYSLHWNNTTYCIL